MASSSVGGLSGAFIPVSEDAGMIAAAQSGALSIEKLEAMTCVCSVGLDMIAVPGDTSVEAIAGLIADEMAIGVINNKTTAVRLIPAIGKKVGDMLEFGGLMGSAPVMPLNTHAGTVFVHRGGRMPAPLNSLEELASETGQGERRIRRSPTDGRPPDLAPSRRGQAGVLLSRVAVDRAAPRTTRGSRSCQARGARRAWGQGRRPGGPP